MEASSINPALLAFWFGALSAASLPIGAALGIITRPRALVISAIMAFGAGSLLAAVALELVIPALERGGFAPLAVGAIIGGLLFVGLNWLINRHGGYWRKRATTLRHMLRSKRERLKSRLTHLAGVDILRDVPPEELAELTTYLARRYFHAGDVIFERGDHADSFFLIDSGEVRMQRPDQHAVTLAGGASFGTRSFAAEEQERRADATAITDVKAWEVFREDFDAIAKRHPRVAECLHDLNEERERQCERRRMVMRQKEQLEEALHELDDIPLSIREDDMRTAEKRAGSAALAIWLGIFLDGIPESAVIGASISHASVSMALIVSLFLANFPEALSSAAEMRERGDSVLSIMSMWSSLVLLTGLGALAGNLFLQDASGITVATFEGCAAGAMLVMIAQTMLPEAYHHGGPVTGMATLAGFLTAVFVMTLGH